MAGKYPARQQARRITLSPTRYLTCKGGRWVLHRQVQVSTPEGEPAEWVWMPMPIGPARARRLIEDAGVEGQEEGKV